MCRNQNLKKTLGENLQAFVFDWNTAYNFPAPGKQRLVARCRRVNEDLFLIGANERVICRLDLELLIVSSQFIPVIEFTADIPLEHEDCIELYNDAIRMLKH